MDDLEWIRILRSYSLLLEFIKADTASALLSGRPRLVHQRRNTDRYRLADLGYAYAPVVETADSQKAEMGNHSDLWTWYLVSRHLCRLLRLAIVADSFSVVATSSVRLYQLSIMVRHGDFTSKYSSFHFTYPSIMSKSNMFRNKLQSSRLVFS